ncbi:MAG: CBS domain-containing protein [Thermoplasmatota archaeon]
MKIKEIMTTDIISVDKDENLKHILSLMKKHNITKIPVVENKIFIGIVTDNIIAYKLGSIRKRSISTSRLYASSVIEKDVTTVSEDTDIKKILQTVGQPGPTMLPVIKEQKLVGIITKADLLFLVDSTQPLNTIIQKNLHYVSPSDRVIHARRIMIDENVARLPVVDEGKLSGIISDIEIAFAFASLKKSFSIGRQKHKLDELTVHSVMKSPVLWSTPTITIKQAAKIMMKNSIGSLPILDDEELIGMVTRTDLLKTVSL